MIKLSEPLSHGKQILNYMAGCQNYGPLLDPYYNTAPNRKGIITLTTTNMAAECKPFEPLQRWYLAICNFNVLFVGWAAGTMRQRGLVVCKEVVLDRQQAVSLQQRGECRGFNSLVIRNMEKQMYHCNVAQGA